MATPELMVTILRRGCGGKRHSAAVISMYLRHFRAGDTAVLASL